LDGDTVTSLSPHGAATTATGAGMADYPWEWPARRQGLRMVKETRPQAKMARFWRCPGARIDLLESRRNGNITV